MARVGVGRSLSAATVYEPLVPLAQVPLPNVSLTEYLTERSAKFGAHPALTDGVTGERVTHEDFPRYVVATARRLIKFGLRAEDIVAVALPNSPSYPIAFHGVLTAGGTVTTVNVQYTVEEMAAQFADSRAKFVITCPQLKATVEAACHMPGSKVQHIFVLGDSGCVVPRVGAPPPEDAPKVRHAFADVRSTFQGQVSKFDASKHIAALPYSSGTTGRPKGVRGVRAARARSLHPDFRLLERIGGGLFASQRW
jgi:acyl-CoA synthetase (AMP-forming)/AMP-acid ligase II